MWVRQEGTEQGRQRTFEGKDGVGPVGIPQRSKIGTFASGDRVGWAGDALRWGPHEWGGHLLRMMMIPSTNMIVARVIPTVCTVA